MKEERILNILSEVDETYIAQAADVKRPPAWHRYLGWGMTAACAVIALCICLRSLTAGGNRPVEPGTPGNGIQTADPAADSHTAPVSPEAEELPILTARFEGGAMGFEGLLYYDISEAEDANPWTEEHAPASLPVYRNPAYTDSSGLSVFLSDEAMLELAEQTAVALGASVDHTEFHRVHDIIDYSIEGLSGTEAYNLTAETAFGEITVYGNGQIRIFFSEPVILPEEYSFTYSHTTDDEAFDVIRYLTERYSGLCSFEKITADTGGDYTYYGDRIRFYGAYDGGGDLTQQILSYHFNRISFGPDDDGNLFVIWLGNLLTGAQKVGDYPLISADTARSFLLSGESITTVPDDYLLGGTITETQIAKTELVYRTGNTSELFMPYYRFYVELTNFQTQTEGLTCYGMYYVPAVSGEYLSDFPVWDGQFH